MFWKIWDIIVRKSFYFRHMISAIPGKVLLSKLDKDKYYILCPFGIGDLCFSVNAIKLKKTDKKIVFITKTAEKNLSEMFGGINMIGDTSLSKKITNYIEFSGKYEGENYFYANFKRTMGNLLRWEYLDLQNKTNFWDDLSKYIYHIPEGSLRGCYQKASGKSDVILTSNDIVLFPNANSVKLISKQFWNKLALMLKEKGYNVYSNVVKDEELIQGTLPLKLQLNQICVAVENCAGCISIRSGICDLLAMYSVAKLHIIHPDDFWIKYGDTKYFRNFNIENYLYDSQDEMLATLSKYF